ncbi:MAG: sugar phosphate isomerase/epimerase family protein [Planctomycetota bacterium]
MKFSICNEFCTGWKIDDVFRFAADVGYNGVEIAPFTLADDIRRMDAGKRKRIKESAEASQVEIVGLHWLLVKPGGMYINHPDAKIRKETLEFMTDLIGFCADLGGKIMVIGSPKQRSVHKDLTFEKAWSYARQVFSACAKMAEKKGVTLCVEPLARTETNFINTHQEAIRMIEEVSSPNFRLLLDVKAMSDEVMEIPDIIAESAPHLAHFHANDANLRGPGFGDTDFVPIMNALKNIDYQGYVSVEVFDFKPDPETIANKSYEYLQQSLAGIV